MHNGTSNSTSDSEEYDYWCTDYPAGALFWASFTGLYFLIGFPACAVLLWELIQRSGRGGTTDIYMFHLTVIDLIFNFFLPLDLYNYLFLKNLPLAHFCDLFFCLNMIGRPLFMSCSSVDCYMAVKYPFTYMQKKNNVYKVAVCMLAWGVTLGYAVLLMSQTNSISTPLASAAYLIALPVIISCDLIILIALRKSGPAGKSRLHPQKQRALRVILNSLIIAFVLYFPPIAVHIIRGFLNLSTEGFLCYAITPVLVTPMACSTVMPLFSLVKMGKLKVLISCFRRF